MSYKYGVVTFFDILGFKNLIQEKSSDEIKGIIDNFYKINSSMYLKTDKFNHHIKTISFSDSIVRTYTLEEEYNELDYCSAIFNELCNLSVIQLELLNQGVLIRGGVSFEKIYCNTNKGIIFGPGLNSAYALESEIANFPRIIVDPEIINKIEDIFEQEDRECKNTICNIMKCLKLDDDGIFFIDYLRQSIALQNLNQTIEYYENNLLYADMKSHKELIVNNVMTNLKSGIKIHQKYNWLTSYHNKTIISIDESLLSKEKKSELFIIEEDSPIFKEFIETCYLYV